MVFFFQEKYVSINEYDRIYAEIIFKNVILHVSAKQSNYSSSFHNIVSIVIPQHYLPSCVTGLPSGWSKSFFTTLKTGFWISFKSLQIGEIEFGTASEVYNFSEIKDKDVEIDDMEFARQLKIICDIVILPCVFLEQTNNWKEIPEFVLILRANLAQKG